MLPAFPSSPFRCADDNRGRLSGGLLTDPGNEWQPQLPSASHHGSRATACGKGASPGWAAPLPPSAPLPPTLPFPSPQSSSSSKSAKSTISTSTANPAPRPTLAAAPPPPPPPPPPVPNAAWPEARASDRLVVEPSAAVLLVGLAAAVADAPT
ncbi:hypothetical protein Vafri_1359 [Volvox africanus]|nr:hypothetical protein Vafri_1359 [Volvox africanus]